MLSRTYWSMLGTVRYSATKGNFLVLNISSTICNVEPLVLKKVKGCSGCLSYAAEGKFYSKHRGTFPF